MEDVLYRQIAAIEQQIQLQPLIEKKNEELKNQYQEWQAQLTTFTQTEPDEERWMTEVRPLLVQIANFIIPLWVEDSLFWAINALKIATREWLETRVAPAL